MGRIGAPRHMSSAAAALAAKDRFAARHLGPRESDHASMLETVGVDSIDDIVRKTVPSQILLDKALDLGKYTPVRLSSAHSAQAHHHHHRSPMPPLTVAALATGLADSNLFTTTTTITSHSSHVCGPSCHQHQHSSATRRSAPGRASLSPTLWRRCSASPRRTRLTGRSSAWATTTPRRPRSSCATCSRTRAGTLKPVDTAAALASGSTTRPPPPQPRASALPLLLGSGPSPFEASRQPSSGRPGTEHLRR